MPCAYSFAGTHVQCASPLATVMVCKCSPVSPSTPAPYQPFFVNGSVSGSSSGSTLLSMPIKRHVASVERSVDVSNKKPRAQNHGHARELMAGMAIKDMPVVGYGRYCGKLVHVSASKCVVEWSDGTRGEYSRAYVARYLESND